MPRSYAEMALLLANKLSDAELLELGEMMDADARHDLLTAIETINEARHPEAFACPEGPEVSPG